MDEIQSGDAAQRRAPSAAEQRERKNARKRAWKANRTPEQIARDRDYQNVWLKANAEKHREHSRKSWHRAKEKAARRAKQMERQKVWREANPERVREYSERWRKANPERARQIARDSYHRRKAVKGEQQRDRLAAYRQDPERKAKQLAYQRANRDKLNARQRELRAANRDKVNAYQQERKKIERRRIALDLPKIKRHRWTKNERLQYERDELALFNKKNTPARLAALRAEAQGVSLDVGGARASEQLEQQAKASQVLAGYLAHLTLKDRVTVRLREIDTPKRRAEIRMDQIALQARGGPKVSVDQTLQSMALKDVLTDLKKQIGIPLYVPPEMAAQVKSRDVTRSAIADRVNRSKAGYETGPHTPGGSTRSGPSLGR